MAGPQLENGDLLAELDLPDPLEGRMAVEIEHAWPQALVDMLEVSRAALIDAGATEDQAGHAATVVVRALASYHGGRSFYLPRGDTLEQAIRDFEIFQAWNRGVSIRALMQRYPMTEQAMYRIVARQRELHRNRIQPGLFPPA